MRPDTPIIYQGVDSFKGAGSREAEKKAKEHNIYTAFLRIKVSKY